MSRLYQVTITVVYTGLKATQYFSADSPDAVIKLKKDLGLLKFPLPKATNVSFVSHGCMGAFWIASLDSQMYQNLSALLGLDPYRDFPGTPSPYTQRDLSKLSIRDILCDSYPYYPELSAGTTTIFKQVRRLRIAKARYNRTRRRYKLRSLSRAYRPYNIDFLLKLHPLSSSSWVMSLQVNSHHRISSSSMSLLLNHRRQDH
ncbi:hypothetical protein F5887DRAFT_37430 [Amanita rubescens]|nr:hypothetical protein F5887DRAFT_37430 [Amanita rubescens]